jgi:hypothetical protein
MRILIDMNIFNEVDKDVFQPTPAVAVYGPGSPMAQIIIHLYVQSLSKPFPLLTLVGP